MPILHKWWYHKSNGRTFVRSHYIVRVEKKTSVVWTCASSRSSQAGIWIEYAIYRPIRKGFFRPREETYHQRLTSRGSCGEGKCKFDWPISRMVSSMQQRHLDQAKFKTPWPLIQFCYYYYHIYRLLYYWRSEEARYTPRVKYDAIIL